MRAVEERLEDAGLAQAIEAFPHAVPMAEALRQSAPANVLDGEEMRKRRSSSALRPRRGRQARNTASVCAQSSSSIFVDIGPGLMIRSESYESCLTQPRNPKNIIGSGTKLGVGSRSVTASASRGGGQADDGSEVDGLGRDEAS
jgi:hypothetical protein